MVKRWSHATSNLEHVCFFKYICLVNDQSQNQRNNLKRKKREGNFWPTIFGNSTFAHTSSLEDLSSRWPLGVDAYISFEKPNKR